MISHWLKVVYLALFLVDLWVITNFWDALGGGIYGVMIVSLGVLNFCLGMGVIQMAYFYQFRKAMEEDDEEVEVHTYSVEKEQRPSRVFQLIDTGKAPDLPPAS